MRKIARAGICKKLVLCVFILAFLIASRSSFEQAGSTGELKPERTITTDAITSHDIVTFETTSELTADGDISDWLAEGIEPYREPSQDIYLAYDNNYVYAALCWEAEEIYNETGLLEKVGMFDDDDAQWEFIDGKDTGCTVAFYNESLTNGDFWTWTASNRTVPGFAYECDENGTPDSGSLPHIRNVNSTYIDYNSKPLYMNDSVTTPDYINDPNGTRYEYWLPNTPNGSQTDVVTGWSHSDGKCIVEFKRLLDTGQTDDLHLNFSSGTYYFHFGLSNVDWTRDMIVNSNNQIYQIGTSNTAASLTFDTIVDEDPSNSAVTDVRSNLLLTGTFFEDCTGYSFYLYCPQLGLNYNRSVSANTLTGEWSLLLLYDPDNLPLGHLDLTIVLDPQYEDPLNITQSIYVSDIEAPEIIGITIPGVEYNDTLKTYFVPLGSDSLYVTAGFADNYFPTDSLSAVIYFDDGNSTTTIPMEQFYPGSTTFTGEIPVVRDNFNYTTTSFSVEVFDEEMNSYPSETRYLYATPLTIIETDPSLFPTPSRTPTGRIGINLGQTLLGITTILALLLGWNAQRKKK